MSDEATLRAKKSIRGALILAGVQVGGALLLTLANKLGWIDSETTTRGVMVLIGLMLVVVGNSMPKKQEDGPPSQTVGDIVVRQSITRVGGWAMLLGGLVWVGLWAFAPRDVAQVGSIAAVATAVVVMLVYAIWRFRSGRSSAS